MPELRRSSTSQSTSSIAGLRTQTVSDRYLDPTRLKAYLNKRFPGQHKVEMKLGNWKIQAPELIPEKDLVSFCT